MPRVSITITDEMHADVQAVAAYTRQSMSALLSEMLEPAQPVFQQMAIHLRALEDLDANGRARLASGLMAAMEAASAFSDRVGLRPGAVTEIPPVEALEGLKTALEPHSGIPCAGPAGVAPARPDGRGRRRGSRAKDAPDGNP